MGSLFVTHPSLIHYTTSRAELLETANDLFAMVGSGKIKIEINQKLSAARGRAGAPRRRGAQDHRLGRADPLSHEITLDPSPRLGITDAGNPPASNFRACSSPAQR